VKVVILGCGPAGLAAASAAVILGHRVVIISKSSAPSKLYGCQYLHAPIPGYEDVPSVRVRYELRGTAEQYRRKVYGEEWQGKVSPEDFIGEHDAWDIRETYARMWEHLIGTLRIPIIYNDASPSRIGELRNRIRHLRPDRIISAIPAPALCVNNHTFTGHQIWANGSTTEDEVTPNLVLCDGTLSVRWYRMSDVFGYRTTEWASRPPAGMNAVPVLKPLATDCDCWPEFLRVGRYGSWRKSALVHEVYPAVVNALEPDERLIRGIERVTGETYLGAGKWQK
jgi:hypothetical protein